MEWSSGLQGQHRVVSGPFRWYKEGTLLGKTVVRELHRLEDA